MDDEVPPRAVVVDDSSFMRTVIADILEDGGVEVVARVGNGEDAVEAVEEHRPDVVTMDVEMPVMGGVEAVERIMDACPTPVLMLSAHTEADADVTFEALDRGAVDFFTKPSGELSVDMAASNEQLVRKVRSVAQSSVRTDSPSTGGDSPSARSVERRFVADPTVVIGASTGGPSVVEGVLAELPAEADLRVLVVQHMPAEFTGRYAERLDATSEYRVREAADGMRVAGGEGAVAPGDHHLEVQSYRRGRLKLGLTGSERVNGVRPAIDVTMESAAAVVTDPLVAVVLTGMGRDGATGARSIASSGGSVIAQDEATSAVFGMPKRVIETGCADAVLPAGDVARGIAETITATEREGVRR